MSLLHSQSIGEGLVSTVNNAIAVPHFFFTALAIFAAAPPTILTTEEVVFATVDAVVFAVLTVFAAEETAAAVLVVVVPVDVDVFEASHAVPAATVAPVAIPATAVVSHPVVFTDAFTGVVLM